jgi:hypothetical protein
MHIVKRGRLYMYNEVNTIFTLCRLLDSVAPSPEWIVGVIQTHVLSMATDTPGGNRGGGGVPLFVFYVHRLKID